MNLQHSWVEPESYYEYFNVICEHCGENYSNVDDPDERCLRRWEQYAVAMEHE